MGKAGKRFVRSTFPCPAASVRSALRFWRLGGLYPSDESAASDGVVVHAPAFGQHAQFLKRVEDFSVEEFIPGFAGCE